MTPTYPFVPSYWDSYGARDHTLGLMLHMAEGTGTVGYLDKDGRIPPRGVSVHFVCETTGRMVQMLRLDQASGSLNPSDRSTDKAYYGHSHLVDVLGALWTNPNEAVISVEIEGFARTGPNGRQVAALVDWAANMKSRFPSLRGALGHADQTDTKGCPGMTAAMRGVFDAIGGHGLWTPEEKIMRTFSFTSEAADGTFTSDGKPGHEYLRLKDNSLHPYPEPFVKHAFGPVTLDGGGITGPADIRNRGYIVETEAAFVIEADGEFVPTHTAQLYVDGKPVGDPVPV